jgi:hypothetical protein
MVKRTTGRLFGSFPENLSKKVMIRLKKRIYLSDKAMGLFLLRIVMDKQHSWYLPNEETIIPDGPYSHDEILAKLQRGDLKIDAFIYGSHFSELRWSRISELPEFALTMAKYPVCPVPKKRSRGLSQTQVTQAQFDFSKNKGEYGIENEYRRFPRAPFKCDIIIHNQKQLLKCLAVDVSEKGLSIQVAENTLFNLGEEVVITLLDTPFAGTFSMNGTVMRSLDKPYQGYGIYFLTINPSIKRKIAQYVIDTLGIGIKERKIA